MKRYYVLFVLSFLLITAYGLFVNQTIIASATDDDDIPEHIQWHRAAHGRIALRREARNIILLRINDREIPFSFLSAGYTYRPAPDSDRNVFNFIGVAETSPGVFEEIDWKEDLKLELIHSIGIDEYPEFDDHIAAGFFNHSEVAALLHSLKFERIRVPDLIVIDMASTRDACRLKCVGLLNSFVHKYRNIIIRYSGGRCDQPGTPRTTRPAPPGMPPRIGIRLQEYHSGTVVVYDSGIYIG